MRIKTIVKGNTSIPSIKLLPLKGGVKPTLAYGNAGFGVREISACAKLPTQRIKVKSNFEKKKLLTMQNQKKSHLEGHTTSVEREETSKFVIDYMPIFFEEELEMMALAMASEQKEKAD